MVTELPNGIRKTILGNLKKVTIVEMDHGTSKDLADKRIVYKQALDQRERIKAFIVKGYESAILVQLGKTIGVLPEGVYEIDKKFQYTGTEIIWVDTTEFKTHWGMADIYLADNVKIGAHGILMVKISDPRKFVMNVVSGKAKVEREQVDDFILTQVVQAYKEILQDFTADDVLRSRSVIQQKVHSKLYEILDHWGIEVITLDIGGFKLPESFNKFYEESAKLEGSSKLRGTQLNHRKKEIEEEAELVALEQKLDALKKSGAMDAEMQIIEKQIQMAQYKKVLSAKERELNADNLDFNREQDLADAQTELIKKKYKISERELEGNVNLDLLEKSTEVSTKTLDKITEKEIELTKIGANKEILIAKARAGISDDSLNALKIEADRDIEIARAKSGLLEQDLENKRSKKETIKIECKGLQKKIDEFDQLLAGGKISEDVYKLRVDMLCKQLEKLENELDKL